MSVGRTEMMWFVFAVAARFVASSAMFVTESPMRPGTQVNTTFWPCAISSDFKK